MHMKTNQSDYHEGKGKDGKKHKLQERGQPKKSHAYDLKTKEK